MRDHAVPTKPQIMIWMSTWRTYSPAGPRGTSGTAARTARMTPATRWAAVTGAAPGDHLAQEEGGHERPHQVPEPTEHADHEGQRTERAPEVRVDGVLEEEE